MKMRLLAFGIVSLTFLAGCAGPMTPFGSVSVFGERAEKEGDREIASELDLLSGPRVRFTPQRQVLHGKAPFTVVIEDPEGVPDDYRFRLTYNGIDISEKFLAKAERIYDPSRRQVKLTTKVLRIIADRENKIRASYWRSEDAKAVSARFLPPICSAFQTAQTIEDTPGFNAPKRMLAFINEHAIEKSLNPHFVAGLIAQESAFDPRAISKNKALGLTQITSLGEAELLKTPVGNWPRYPGLAEMPLPVLKMAIVNGEVNSKNEWRLDPALSILGGVEYLTYLTGYWSRSDKRTLVEQTLGSSEATMGEVLLASYNSGAARVSQAIERKGKAWLEDEELGEARKYVKRVVSYCDYFSNEGD